MIKNSQRRRTDRIKSANERKAARDARTPKQQLASLDAMLGKGEGAVKERARLKKQMAKVPEKVAEKKE